MVLSFCLINFDNKKAFFTPHLRHVPPRHEVDLERRYDIGHNMLEPILNNLSHSFIANHIRKREEGGDKIWCEKRMIKLIRLSKLNY
jgi:hypothetical protein